MPRIARIVGVQYLHHIVQRGNNREKVFLDPEDFKKYLFLLQKYSNEKKARILAYCLMGNHLLLQSPAADVVGRPLRWFMTQTAKTFHRLRNRCGHFWERRYRICLVEDDLSALAALRYMDRNPVCHRR